MSHPSAAFRVFFAPHPDHGPQDDFLLFGIDAKDGFTGYGAEALVGVAAEVMRQACVKAAARHVDYDEMMQQDGDNDSSYLDLCDRLALEYQVTKVVPIRRLEQQRYHCIGIDLESDGMAWEGLVEAADVEEAKFQAKFAMALANGGDRLLASDNTRKYDNFVKQMDSCGIDLVKPVPVTTEEMAQAARDLLAEGPGGDAAARVSAMLEKLGLDGAPPTPRM